MTHTGNSDDPTGPDADDLFAAGGGRPAPTAPPGDDPRSGAAAPTEPVEREVVIDEPESGSGDDEEVGAEPDSSDGTDLSEATMPYPDGPGPADSPYRSELALPPETSAPTQAAPPDGPEPRVNAAFDDDRELEPRPEPAAPPEPVPPGWRGHGPVDSYPAGPADPGRYASPRGMTRGGYPVSAVHGASGTPAPPMPDDGTRFTRREPMHGPPPDEDGLYPSDYYVGPDWMRIVVGGLITVTILLGLAAGGLYLVDRFDPRDDETSTEEATPTPVPFVPVFQCAGDAQAVSQMTAPADSLIAGRTADSRWLAFRNPQGTPLQLWIRSSSVPDFDAQSVGIVSCARSPNEFPTPIGAATPLPTLEPDPTPEDTTG